MSEASPSESAPRPRVGLVGAHTALAAAIVEAVSNRGLEVEWVRISPLAAIGDEDLLPAVEPLVGCSAILWLSDDPTLVALARDPRLAARPSLVIASGPSGPSAEDEPPAEPGLTAPIGPGSRGPALTFPLHEPGSEVWQRLLPGIAQAVFLVVVALRALEPVELDATLLESAALLDKAGMDALQEQVRGLFGLQEPEGQVLGGRLAFNLRRRAAPDEDRGLEAALLSATGLASVRATRVWTPTFSAEAAVLRLRFRAPVARAALEAGLAAGRGLRFVRDETPSAEDALGRDDALVSLEHVEDSRAELWVVADRLGAGSAAPAAVFVERILAAV